MGQKYHKPILTQVLTQVHVHMYVRSFLFLALFKYFPETTYVQNDNRRHEQTCAITFAVITERPKDKPSQI
jgi:hypothetical protein